MEKILHNFAWGDTRGVRQEMTNLITPYVSVSMHTKLKDCGYPPHEGKGELLTSLKCLIRNLTGRNYKYILVTNGATNGLGAYIYAKQNEKGIRHLAVQTNNLYFGFYPKIIKIHGCQQIKDDSYVPLDDQTIRIIDSPSNPEGKLSIGGAPANCVWDAAYFSPTYCGVIRDNSLACPRIIPNHDAMVGSMNKLTGINGLRVGWLATDDFNIYNKAFEFVEADLCGVTGQGQDMSQFILQSVDLDKFFLNSKRVIDSNRQELRRLDYLFGNQRIYENGMFALFEVDQRLKDLFLQANVVFMDGASCGDSRDSVRINLGNTNDQTKDMVNAILKEDGNL